ncbi:MAG: divalent-cation tolerance protein CutA [Acidobacteria bacterium]|nr:divalent-cation tolerance protein CutA [Acidobacteriota bacterium]
MTKARIILTTAGSRAEAEKIASALVSERLAACVNIMGPVESHYRWKGKVEKAAELMLLVKTAAAVAAKTSARIRELHSYEAPEIVVLQIDGGDNLYLKWLAGCVEDKAKGKRQKEKGNRALKS